MMHLQQKENPLIQPFNKKKTPLYKLSTKINPPYTTFQLNIKYGFTWNKDKQVLCWQQCILNSFGLVKYNK